MCAAIYRNFETQEELDQAYNVEASVPDFMAYAHQYIEGSAQTRRDLTHYSDVYFGPTVEEYCDIFPADKPGSPVMIFIHGGYWRMLNASDFSFTARGFVKQGVTTIVANYALCPKVSISEIVRQMRALISWSYKNISKYNGDPENLHVSGHSAGGHLTAMCALTDWAGDYGLPNDVMKSATPISGLFDLEPIRRTYMQPDLRIREDEVSNASPQLLVKKITTPTLITYGGDETSEFQRHSEEFFTEMKRKGNRVTFFPQIGRNHFTTISDLADADAPLTRTILEIMGLTPTRHTETASRSGYKRVPSVRSLL